MRFPCRAFKTYPGLEIVVVERTAGMEPSSTALILAGHEQAMISQAIAANAIAIAASVRSHPSLANLLLDLLAHVKDDAGAVELQSPHGPGIHHLDAQGEDLRRHLGHHFRL